MPQCCCEMDGASLGYPKGSWVPPDAQTLSFQGSFEGNSQMLTGDQQPVNMFIYGFRKIIYIYFPVQLLLLGFLKFSNY